MKEQLISQIVPIIITCIIGILVVLIKAVSSAIIAFIDLKKQEVIKRIGQDKYYSDMAVARDVWNIVEEHFRINKILQNITTTKIEYFSEQIKKKLPYITQDDIDYLRQAIAGEMNSCKLSEPSQGKIDEPAELPTEEPSTTEAVG